MNRPSREQLRAGVVGALIALALVAVGAFGWSTYVVWTRALHGEIAYEFISQQIQAQQKPPTTPLPAKPSTP